MSWKAKLIVFTICIYFTSASYTMIVPFLPLYLLELGANQNNIEFWTAVIFSVSFFVGGVMAPLWGKLADKKGQKSMSVRSSAMLCIAYLCGGGYKEVIHTVVNALAVVSGIVCDGAKASCAAKIASAVDAGILGYNMYIRGQQFLGGDGIVTKGVERTIENVGRLGKEGMRETNEEIIKIMIGE